MLIREVADQSKYYHDVLAAQLPAGLSDDNDIVGKAFVIAGMKLGMVKAARLFRETPIEQDIVTAYRQLHNELKETAAEDDLDTAQEIGAQLQSAMEDLYYAHRMGNPSPTVKQNIDMLQKSIRSFNQELNGLGYKYAPTVPGLVARMGTRYVEADDKIAPVAPPLSIQPTRTQPKQHVHTPPEKKTPAVVNHIKSKDVKEGNLNEFSPIKPPTAGAFGGNKDYGQPTSSRYLGNNKFVLGTTNNYVLTATVDKWGLEWDEDDEIWFLDSPGSVYIADATEGEIELPSPQEQRNQIHDLVSDYLNARNSAELQRVAAYYGHSADGEMATSEGWGGALVGAIGGGMIGGPVGAAVGGAAGYALGGNSDDLPNDIESAYELGKQAAEDGQTDEDNPYEEGIFGPSEAMEAWYEGWTDGKAAQSKATPPKQALAPPTTPSKTTTPTKTSGSADFSKRGFTGYKKPGDVDEGIRVPAQQILGTKNRAKTAYYPTNVKPKVPKLDKPLTDQELVRLAQLAGIKSK